MSHRIKSSMQEINKQILSPYCPMPTPPLQNMFIADRCSRLHKTSHICLHSQRRGAHSSVLHWVFLLSEWNVFIYMCTCKCSWRFKNDRMFRIRGQFITIFWNFNLIAVKKMEFKSSSYVIAQMVSLLLLLYIALRVYLDFPKWFYK